CGACAWVAWVVCGWLSRARVNRTMPPSTTSNAAARPMVVERERERAVRLGGGGRDGATSVGCRATGSRLLLDTAATGSEAGLVDASGSAAGGALGASGSA